MSAANPGEVKKLAEDVLGIAAKDDGLGGDEVMLLLGFGLGLSTGSDFETGRVAVKAYAEDPSLLVSFALGFAHLMVERPELFEGAL